MFRSPLPAAASGGFQTPHLTESDPEKTTKLIPFCSICVKNVNVLDQRSLYSDLSARTQSVRRAGAFRGRVWGPMVEQLLGDPASSALQVTESKHRVCSRLPPRGRPVCSTCPADGFGFKLKKKVHSTLFSFFASLLLISGERI